MVDGDGYYDKDSLDSFILRNVMKHNPLSLTPEDSVAEVLITMAKYNTSCVPIVNEEKKVMGMVTNQEIVNFVVTFLK